MAFPVSPTNGQQAIVNGITYQYASATNSWARVAGIANTISASGNITAANFITAGIVTATGNVTGNYFLGNGSQLTGLPATYGNANVAAYLPTYTGNLAGGNLITTSNVYVGTGNAGYVYGNAYYMTGISAAISVTKIENGNSNVWVNTPGGDVTVSAGGVSNVAVFSTGSLTLSGAFGTPKTITKNVVIAPDINAMLVGPLTFADGVSLTVPDSSTVYVYSPS
jgi:hypothetical protein